MAIVDIEYGLQEKVVLGIDFGCCVCLSLIGVLKIPRPINSLWPSEAMSC